MKSLRFLLLSAAVVLSSACGGEDDPNFSGDYGAIKMPDTRELAQSLDADRTSAGKGVTFTAEAAWSAEIVYTRADDASWLSVSPDRGEAGTYTLTITAEQNTGGKRSAKIIVRCGADRIEISVTQAAAAGDGDEDEPSGTLVSSTVVSAVWYDDDMPSVPEFTANFGYDQDRRLVYFYCAYDYCSDWESNTLTWNSDRTVTVDVESHYISEGNETVDKYTYSMTLDAAGCAVSSEDEEGIVGRATYDGGRIATMSYMAESGEDYVDTFTWQDGNLTKIVYGGGVATVTCSYSDRINPFFEETVDPVFLNTHIESFFEEWALGFAGRRSRALVERMELTGEWGHVTSDFEYAFDRYGRIELVKVTNTEYSDQGRRSFSETGTFEYR